MASYDKNLTLYDKSISGVIDQNIVALYHYTSYAYHIYIKASLISKKGITMNVNYIKLLSTITILTISMNVTAGFDENFVRTHSIQVGIQKVTVIKALAMKHII